MTEHPTINWPVKPYRIEVSPVPWGWLYSFVAYVLIFAGIGGVIFFLDWGASQVRHQPSAATSLYSDPQPSPYSQGELP